MKFFDDDPRTALKQRGLEAADFTVDTPWDAYPLVGCLLEIWSLTERYVNAVVKDLYRDDADVESDAGLGAWMDASRDPLQGNVRGLPPMHRRDDLSAVLTSLLYRVTAHGAASLPRQSTRHFPSPRTSRHASKVPMSQSRALS